MARRTIDIPGFPELDAREQNLDQLLSGANPEAPERSVEDRIAAAIADINANNANAARARQTAAAAVREGLASWTQYRALMESPDLSDDGRKKQIDAHRAQYAGRLVASVEAMTQSIDAVGSAIMQTPPDFAPSNAVEAATINGIMADYDAYDPPTAVRVARDAIARRNLPLCKRISDKLGGYVSWKKPFVDSGKVSDVLVDLAAALTTPDIIRSEAASRWVEDAESDVRFLVSNLRNGDGSFDKINIVVGALGILFPDRVYPK